MMSTSSPSSNSSFPSSPEVADSLLLGEASENQSIEKVSKHRPSYFTPKIKFSPHEDVLLLHAVQSLGTGDWHIIASRVPGRNARQCRERWNNYVNPALISAPWTAEEDRFLMEKYQELGPHWRTIASLFASRSTNSIKNRFTILQRRQRKKNRKAKDKKASMNISLAQNAQPSQQQQFLCSSSISVSPASHPTVSINQSSTTNSPMISSPESSSDDNSGSNDFIFINEQKDHIQKDPKKSEENDDIFNILELFKDSDYSFWSNDFDALSYGFSDINYF